MHVQAITAPVIDVRCTIWTVPRTAQYVTALPGGTASNLVTYLAKANVALSVVLTTVSTVLASCFTPLLTKQLAVGPGLLVSSLLVHNVPCATASTFLDSFLPPLLTKQLVVGPGHSFTDLWLMVKRVARPGRRMRRVCTGYEYSYTDILRV